WTVNEVEALPHGEQRVTTGTGWFYGGVVLEECDGAPWLVATGSPQPHAPALPDGPAFLLSLINLVKQPIQWERLDQSVTATAACQWCTQYGLPMVEAIFPYNRCRPGLSLSFFQRETLTLVLLWKVQWAYFYKDRTTLDSDLPQLWKARANQRREATDAWRA